MDNLILSQKVFVINAVLKWCLTEKATKNKMTTSRDRWNKYNKIISQYIAGVVDLKWKK